MGGLARRRFLIAAASALAAPFALGRPPYRIGVLPDHVGVYLDWLVEGMRRHGWREGRDFTLVQPGLLFGVEHLEAARRVVGAQPDAIFTVGTHYALAAQRLTAGIPIVAWSSGYPVEAGLARSLSRPGRNFTGNAAYAGTEIWGKLIELLREVRPQARRVGVLMCYVPPHHPEIETEMANADLREGARRLGVALHIVPLADARDADAALRDLAAAAPEVVVLTTGLGIWPVRQKVLGFALAQGWPTIADVPWNPHDELQPLMHYGPSMERLIHDAAAYVVRILRDGAQPGDLPIRRPASFELSVNLGTAKALGLEVPSRLLLQADRVIE